VRDTWLSLVDSVLRPARPELATCLVERARHAAEQRLAGEGRTRLRVACEASIESLRATVFAAKDGIVLSRMTDLEREWRRLSRTDPDGGLMELWARIAPPSFVDRKLWRDSDPAAKLDAAIALAADGDAVARAERAVESFRAALAPWGVTMGARIRWRPYEGDGDCVSELLAGPFRAAFEELSSRGVASVVLERAQRLERDVLDRARARFPDAPRLAGCLGHSAFVEYVFQAASLGGRLNPVTALRELLATGYVLSALDATAATLGFPPL
jgi:hypothetical protein